MSRRLALLVSCALAALAEDADKMEHRYNMSFFDSNFKQGFLARTGSSGPKIWWTKASVFSCTGQGQPGS